VLRFAVSVCLLTACSSQPAVQGANAGCRERVVSLHDVTTEAVLRYEAQSCLVGVAEPTDLAVELQAQLKGIPRVESTESVLAARPTQVLALAIIAEHQPELFRELDQRGIRWTAPRLERVSDVARLAADVGKRLDRESASRSYTDTLEALRGNAATAQLKRPRVFVFDCCTPPFTAGRRAVLTDVLAHAGADNVFADVDDDWFNASWEAAIARKPDLVLIDDYGDPSGLAKKREALARIAPLADLPVVVLPLRDALGTIRSAEVIQRLTTAIARSLG
jgi:ABC-type Fe3+-hydroxamate transport system substrate-binding protein